MDELTKHALAPTWCFPFRLLGKNCTFVAQSVWSVRWQRELTPQQKLLRAQQFRAIHEGPEKGATDEA